MTRIQTYYTPQVQDKNKKRKMLINKDKSCGKFLTALTMVILHITDPATTESLAAWRAVNLCRDLGFTHVILEGDSLLVVSAISKDSPR